jgi:glutamate-1-semialdehyde aminotransferase
MALQFSQGIEANTVYVSKQAGSVHVLPADMEAGVEVPEDIETSDEFLQLPDRRDFDLGNELAYRFTEIEMPQEYDNVRNMFHHKGAYGNFKQLLQSKKLLQRWTQYEDEQTQAALREWCEQNGLALTK